MPCRSLPPLSLLTIAILAVLPALSAQAGPQPQQQDRGRGQQRDSEDRGQQGRQEPRSSLSDAVRRVERDTRGEVLSAERIQYDGRDMHRVKVVDDQGRVRVFMQDPQQRRNDNGSAGTPPPRGNRDSRREPPARDDDD